MAAATTAAVTGVNSAVAMTMASGNANETMTACPMPAAAMTTATMTPATAAAGRTDVSMATVMLPAVPALAAAEAEAATKFVADNVPAGPVPAVIVPSVILTVGDIGVARVVGRRRNRRIAQAGPVITLASIAVRAGGTAPNGASALEP